MNFVLELKGLEVVKSALIMNSTEILLKANCEKLRDDTLAVDCAHFQK